MNVRRLATRTAALVLPAALVLGATGTALAAKPPRTPAPVVTSTPAQASNSKTATFDWTVAPSTAYTCSLDGAVYTTCAAPQTYSNLTDRAHTFALKAKLTTQSNSKASTYSYAWTVDTVAPLAPIVSPIAGPTSNTSAAVSFSDTDTSVTGFTCALDGGAAAPCTSPQPYSGLSEAAHTVVVTARDAAGNTASGSVSWTVDLTAPNIPVVSGPPNPTNDPDAGVTFSGNGVTYTCALDAEAAAPCTSPWTRTGLADGSHTLTVTPYDDVVPVPNAGTPGTATWVVDTAPPAAPVLVSAPASTTNDPNFTVRVGTTDPSTAGFMCTFQTVTTPCSSTWAPDVAFVPVNGAYSVSIVARDLAGNLSTPLTASWTFDIAAPSPAEFLAGPGTPTNVADPVFDWIDTDTSTETFDCSVDGAPRVACVPGASLSSLAPGVVFVDGPHALSVRALDALANASSAVVWNWVLDRTGPVSQPHVAAGVPLSSGPVTSTPTFVFTTDDPNAVGFVCKLDGATTWTPCASGYTPAVGDGSHSLQVATVDQAGNPGPPITYTWTLDTRAPYIAAFNPPTTLAGTAKVTFNEPVLGVSSSSVRLIVAGTTSVVASTVSCRNASNATVSCASASGVRAVVVSHSARLMAGQRYAVKVTNAVHDLAGNAKTTAVLAFRAQRVLQEGESAVGQAWASRTSTSAYGGRYVVARHTNALASYAFRGTSITWYTQTGPAMGTANVYCGSTYKGRVNNYSTTTKSRVARTVKCSSTTANNTLRVVATGLKGSTAGKGTLVVVDAVKVGSTLITNPALSLRWATATSKLASGGRYAFGDLSGEAFSLTFRGTSITWRTLFGKNMGKAKVYVDGVYKGSYDQFATTSKAVTRTWKLTDKVHTIKVVVSGTRRTGATGTRVVLDSLTVG